MEKVHVLFSGGKDSSLSAILLKKLGYELELITINFGILDSYRHAQETAKILGLPHSVEFLDGEILEKSVDIILKDGFPSNGIQYIHKTVIEILSDKYKLIADGTRRDDRVPKLSHSEIQSIEMRKKIQYITPLTGFGHKTIRSLVDNYFVISEKESEDLLKSDYETEIRELIKLRGENPLDYFPKHIQSRVIGLKEKI
jgi:predicted subunit of tRNA(5-methylaminomethyl-2-thiouridylate) methyltransferase